MLYNFIFAILTVFALSIGQILFKMAASEISLAWPAVLQSLLSKKLILALFVYFFATAMWLLVLRNLPLRVAYPFASLAFIVVPLLAHYLLGEKIYWNTFLGAGLILTGVLVSVYK